METSTEEIKEPSTISEDTLIPVKFNKEIKNVPLTEAANFIQKGMKFDAIIGEYSRLKDLAVSRGRAVGEYITALESEEKEKRYNCLLEELGGNEQAAQRIMELESREAPCREMEEIKEYFPNITDESALPQEVVEKAQLSGDNLLNTYLRYLLKAEREKQRILKEKEDAANSSPGSQSKNEGYGFDITANQFLKGIWGK